MLVKAGQVSSTASATNFALYNGSNCTGTSGTINRTLDLSGVAVSEILHVQGSYLHPSSDYTKATVGSVSRLTFINKLYDNFIISVYYWM